MPRTRQERETVIRFDDTDELASLSTFSATQARRWQRAGVALTRRGGEWLGRVEKAAVRGCRRVDAGGHVVKKAPSTSGTAHLREVRRTKSSEATTGGDPAPFAKGERI